MNAVKEFQRRRKKRLEKRMRSAKTEDEMMRVAYALYRAYHEDGGPGSGNHNHAGRIGERGGSAPSGAADSKASSAKLASFKDKFNSCSNDTKYDYLKKTGVLSTEFTDRYDYGGLKKAVAEGDEDAIKELEQEIQKAQDTYFEAAEKAREPQDIDVPKRDELMKLSDDEKQEWAYASQDRELTDDEKKWANDRSDFQKVAIDLGMNGTPQVVCGDDFDKYVEDNDAIVMYRGLRDAPDFSVYNMQYETLYEGDKPFIGNGVIGDGLYFSAEKWEAQGYGYGRNDSHPLMTCAIRPDAKIVDDTDPEYDRAYYDYGRDESTAAAMLGYDVVRHKGSGDHPDNYIVLNKAALIARDPMDGEMDKILNS